VARGEGARIFHAPSTFGVGLLQKFNQQEPRELEKLLNFESIMLQKLMILKISKNHTERK